ncbi:AraC family transcriptional regulator [Bacteroides oleiciplenus]|uniref:AraC family transcriptional regulator n=1 Tax=Bacteroides oleiciplenus TaxID=626931 RepID=UPI0026DC83F6|nr:helix-turn-helix domain-containing protein [Bacteroides oleiciplenus]
MDYQLNTPLNGNLAMTSCFHENKTLQQDTTLYKFIWVRSGILTVEIDHIPMRLEQDEIACLTPLHHIEIKEVEGEYLTFLFNSNFYCIFGHDDEVSCNGFLFHGSSQVMRLKLSPEQSTNLNDIVRIFRQESTVRDNLQEEMLRIILKRFIITCTRIAREKCGVTPEQEKAFDIVRRFYILVDQNFREKKQVRDYADLLFRSPKTLSNLFSSCGVPSPLRIIHERVEAEAKRLLLYTPKSAKEISELLGFEDLSTFSRFFKKMAGESVSDFRKSNTTGSIAN